MQECRAQNAEGTTHHVRVTWFIFHLASSSMTHGHDDALVKMKEQAAAT